MTFTLEPDTEKVTQLVFIVMKNSKSNTVIADKCPLKIKVMEKHSDLYNHLDDRLSFKDNLFDQDVNDEIGSHAYNDRTNLISTMLDCAMTNPTCETEE